MLKAIVFDFDGVILESVDIKTRAFRALFKGYPEHVDRIVRLHLDNGGLSRFEKFKIIYRDFLGQAIDEDTLARLGDRFSDLVYDEVIACAFVPGAHEFLSAHAKRYSLFVASGTPEEEMRGIVQARGLGSFFAGVCGSPRTKAEILRDIMAENRLEPADVVFVGDTLTDYAGARAAGVPFIGRVPSGASSPFPPDGTLATVEDLRQLELVWLSLVESR